MEWSAAAFRASPGYLQIPENSKIASLQYLGLSVIWIGTDFCWESEVENESLETFFHSSKIIWKYLFAFVFDLTFFKLSVILLRLYIGAKRADSDEKWTILVQMAPFYKHLYNQRTGSENIQINKVKDGVYRLKHVDFQLHEFINI